MKLEKIKSENIACIIAIVIGGIFALLNPDRLDEAMEYTAIAVILIKLFW